MPVFTFKKRTYTIKTFGLQKSEMMLKAKQVLVPNSKRSSCSCYRFHSEPQTFRLSWTSARIITQEHRTPQFALSHFKNHGWCIRKCEKKSSVMQQQTCCGWHIEEPHSNWTKCIIKIHVMFKHFRQFQAQVCLKQFLLRKWTTLLSVSLAGKYCFYRSPTVFTNLNHWFARNWWNCKGWWQTRKQWSWI